MEKEKIKKYIIIGVLIIWALFLGYGLLPYLNALFGALIFYVLFKPLYFKLIKLGFREWFSASIVILITLFIILIPIVFLVNSAIYEGTNLIENREYFTQSLKSIDERYPDFEVIEFVNQSSPFIIEWAKNFIINATQGIIPILIQLIIMYFLLYYLLVDHKRIKSYIYKYIPFKKKNIDKLSKDFKRLTYSSVVATGIIALVQGGLLGLTFWICGIEGAVFWGFAGVIVSFLPVIGPPVIWVPALVFKYINMDYTSVIILLIMGIIIGISDNILRPIIQGKIGKIHPLTTILGLFLGIKLFGIFGVVMGPLILSFFFSIIKIFREENTNI